MADKKLTLIVRAKNMVAQGLSAAGSAVASFAKSVGSALASIAKWVGIASSALGGISAVGAVRAFVAQEKAIRDLEQALRLNGDAVDVLMPKYKRLSAEIQDQTGFADEAVLSIAAQARMYGVAESKLEDAVRGTVALTRAGMDQEAAVKALASASNGNFQVLSRYIPALRSATSEAEKAAIVNDYLSKQYAAARGDLNTTAGAWMAFKGRIGDALETVGQFIVEAVDLPGLLNKTAEAAKRLGERFQGWLDSDKFKRVKEEIHGIMSALGQGGEARQKAVAAIGNVLVASLARGAEIAVDALKTAAPIIGKLIGAAAKMAWDGLTNRTGSREENFAAAKQIGMVPEGRASKNIWGDVVVDINEFSDAQKEILKRQVEKNRNEKMFRDLGVKNIEVIEGQTAAQTRLNAAVAAMVEIGRKASGGEYGNATDQFEQAQADARKDAKQTTGSKKGIDIAAVNEAEIESARRKANLDALEKETAEKVKASQATVDAIQAEVDAKKEAAGQIDQLNEAVFQAEKERLEKILAMEEYKARIKVKDFVDLQKANDKARKADERDAERDQRKADRLRARLNRGENIGGGQERWLEGFDAIKNAQAGLGVANQNLEEIRKNQDSRNLDLIRQSLDKNLAELQKKIRLG
jgi:hypothetical protein